MGPLLPTLSLNSSQDLRWSVMGIHNYDLRLRMALNLLNKTDLLPVNKQYLLDFVDFLRASGLSKARIERYIYTLKDLALIHGQDFKKLSKKGVVRLISVVESLFFCHMPKRLSL